MPKRSPTEIETARQNRLANMRAWTAKLLAYDPLAFAGIPRFQQLAMVQGRLATDKARKNGKRLARSMPDAEAPNPLALQHGTYVKTELGKDKAVVAYNRTVTPLQLASHRGQISPRLLSAGEHFERDHIRAYHGVGSRDCLDTSPRGQGTIPETAAILVRAARDRLAQIEREAGHATYNRLVDVCVHQAPTGRSTLAGWARLMAGLEIVASFYRLPQ